MRIESVSDLVKVLKLVIFFKQGKLLSVVLLPPAVIKAETSRKKIANPRNFMSLFLKTRNMRTLGREKIQRLALHFITESRGERTYSSYSNVFLTLQGF